jgi:hypothetical protein
MDELIATIYEITIKMHRTLKEENYETFEELLNERNTMMNRVDTWKADHPLAQSNQKEKRLLEDALCLDQRMTPLLKENIIKIKTSIAHIKKNKQVSKKYRPFMKQTNGVFVDAKK